MIINILRLAVNDFKEARQSHLDAVQGRIEHCNELYLNILRVKRADSDTVMRQKR
jgi:hypothetical protein